MRGSSVLIGLGGMDMLDYIRRGTDNAAPIGDLPQWLSGLLRNRGVDTP